jgi:hypothetical protein
LRPLQSYGEQKGRLWLRVSRGGETVYSWGEKPEEGLGLAPHESKTAAEVIVPLQEASIGDVVQVQSPSRAKRGHDPLPPSVTAASQNPITAAS